MYNNKSIKSLIAGSSLFLCTLSASALATPLPETLKNTINKAYQTKDAFILDTILDKVKTENPDLKETIQAYVISLKAETLKQAKKEKKKAKKTKEIVEINKEAETKNFSGNVEFGSTFETGNTQKEELKTNASLSYEKEKWQNITKLKASNGKENDTRYDEEYRINNQLRYNRSNKDYFFGEAEYVNDRFSGFDYRISELAGYGYKLLSTDTMSLSVETSIGARQSKFINSDTENSFLGKIGQTYTWDINKNLSFSESLGISLASDSTITEFEAAFKSKITDSLYLKASFEVEHISDVPANTKKTDTVAGLTLGYDFEL